MRSPNAAGHPGRRPARPRGALRKIIGRSDVEVDLPVEEPIEDILDIQDENETAPRPPIGVVRENVTPGLVVRVSGPQGTVYSGAYGTTQGGMVPVDGVLGAVPAEYGIEAWGGASKVTVQ